MPQFSGNSMRCPRCGAASNVLETRSHEYGTTIRRRECENYHRFQTVEIYRECYGSAKQRASVYERTMKTLRERWRRNIDIALNSHLGAGFFMEKYKVSRTAVFNALRAGRYELNMQKKRRESEPAPTPVAPPVSIRKPVLEMPPVERKTVWRFGPITPVKGDE